MGAVARVVAQAAARVVARAVVRVVARAAARVVARAVARVVVRAVARVVQDYLDSCTLDALINALRRHLQKYSLLSHERLRGPRTATGLGPWRKKKIKKYKKKGGHEARGRPLALGLEARGRPL